MRSLLISDLHSNREAMATVLRHVSRKRVGQLICLGDVVGYGAHPNQVLEMLRRSRRKKFVIRGNHDRVAIGKSDAVDFNNAASDAILWTRERLSRVNLAFLRDLPAGPIDGPQGTLLCHGSPDDEDEYVLSEMQAARILGQWPHRLIFFGHTHLPYVYRLKDGYVQSMLVVEPMTLTLERDCRYLINPGSVGQPRDRDWRTSFAVWDDEKDTIRFCRLAYDVATTQQAIMEAGLPAILADRLSSGF